MAARALAAECFRGGAEGLLPALIDGPLYTHQERAIRTTHVEALNVVVATGSGKTESFIYPVLFELYRQHLAGELEEPGVRAMILYPMNALANDQRERLGKICRDLKEAGSEFEPTFGQYIGQTPENAGDRRRYAAARYEACLPGELVFREEMRRFPPHVLLTNYSMLEYLLIRPDDSLLFDGGRGTHWQFVVLDEAHQYRGARASKWGCWSGASSSACATGDGKIRSDASPPARRLPPARTTKTGRRLRNSRENFSGSPSQDALSSSANRVRPATMELPGASTRFSAHLKAPSSFTKKTRIPWCSIERARADLARPGSPWKSRSVESAASITMSAGNMGVGCERPFAIRAIRVSVSITTFRRTMETIRHADTAASCQGPRPAATAVQRFR